MAKYSNTVEYNIRTTLDTSGVTKLQAQLTQLQNQVKILGAKELMPAHQISNTLTKIKQIQNALTQAFNPKLGMLNTSAFMKNLQQAGLSMNGIYQTFSKVGPAGERAFASMYGQISKIDTGMRSVSKTTDKIMNTFGNTVRWGIIASAFASVMRAVHGAAQYVSDLDKSLTNIQMVTASARDTMNDFAVEANKVAQRLGGTTVQMTNATEVFIRQGYDLATSTQLGEYAVHLANVSGQDSAMASDEITAYMNAFKIPLEDLGNAVSKWAAVANNAAVSVEELSVASQKAAAVATTVGVDMDQFAAHIAAIEATTREAPENIGNGLKTIYSRIADVKLGETLEDGVDLGSFAKAIEKVGVQVLDSTGSLRDAGDILQDLMVVWQDLDQTQRAAVAKTVAGRFQLARFEALMNSADIYQKALTTSQAETGTATYDRMQETYRNSLEGRSKALQASVEEIFLNVFTTDSFYGFVDAAQAVVDIFNKLVKAAGGGEAALTGLLMIITKMGQNNLSRGISNFIVNRQSQQAMNQNVQNAQAMAAAQLQGKGLVTNNARLNAFANDTARVQQYAPMMNDEQIRKSNELIEQRVQILNQLSAAEQQQKAAETQLRAAIAAIAPGLKLESEALLKQIEAWERDGIAVETTSKEFLGLQQKLFSSAEAVTGFTETLWQIKEGAEQDQLALQGFGDRAFRLSETLHGLVASGVLVGEELTNVAKAEELLKRISAENITTQDGLIRALEKVGTTLTEVNGALARAPRHMRQIIQSHNEATSSATKLASAEKEIAGAQKLMENGLYLQKVVSGFVDLSGAAMSVLFAFQSLKGIINTLKDENISLADKVDQIAMNFVMLAALGIPAIQQSVQAIKTLKEAWAAYRTEQTLVNQNALAVQGTSAIAQAGVHQGIYTALKEEALAQHVLNEEKIKSIAISQGSTVEKVKETMGIMGLVGAEEAQIKEEEKLTAVQVLTNNIGKTKLGQLYLETLAKLGLIKVNDGLAKSEIALAVSAKIAQMGIKGILLAALPLAAVIGTFLAIGAAVNYISEQEEKRKQRLDESIKANEEAIKVISDNGTNLNKLYHHYKETGSASDELKESLLKQAEAVGIVNAEIYTASGQYETLKRKIDAATASILNYNQALLSQKQEEIIEEELDDPVTGSGLNGLLSNSAAWYAGFDFSETIASYIPFVRLFESDISSNVHRITKALSKAKEELASINGQIHSLEIREKSLNDAEKISLNTLRNQRDTLEEYIDNYNEVIGQESIQKYLSNETKLAENEFQSVLWDENRFRQIFKDANSFQDYVDILKNSKIFPNLNAYLDSLTSEQAEEYVKGLVSKIASNLDDSNLQKEVIKNMTLDSIFDDFYKAHPNIDRSSVEDPAQIRKITSDFIQKTQGTLTQQDQLKLLASIDYSKSEEEIKATIKRIQDELAAGKSAEIIVDIITKPKFSADTAEYYDQATAYSAQTISDILKEADIDQDTFEKYQKDWLKNTDSLTEAQKKLNGEIKEGTEIAADFSSQEDLDEFLQDTTAAALQTYNGLKKLQKITEETFETLSNIPDINWENGDIEPATLKSIEDLRDATADTLNVESDLVSNTFLRDHLSEIQEAASGDLDALNQLQDAFARDYIANLDVNLSGLSVEETKEELLGYLDEIQATLPDMEVGAVLDNTDFYAALTDLLDNTNLTIADLNAMFGNVTGLEFDVEPVATEVPSIEAAFHSSFDAAQLTGAGLLGAIGAGIAGAVEWVTGNNNTIHVPKLVARKTGSGSGGGGRRYSPSSGGKKSSGGGGGGGGSKGKSIKAIEPKDANVDPYQKVNAELEKLADEYTEVDKAKDRMYGDRYRRAQEQEIKNLQQQNEKLEERVKISEKLIEAYRTGQDNPEYGIYVKGESFDKYGFTDEDLDGIIDNPWDRIEELRKDYYAKVEAANAYAGEDRSEEDQAEFERLSAIADEAHELWSGAQNFANEYQEAWDKVRDDTQQIRENMYEIEDKIIDVWNYAKDAAKELGEFREDQIDLAETLATLWGDDAVKSLGFAFDRFTNMFEANEKSLADAIIDYQNRLNKATDENMRQWYQDQIDLAQKAMANGTSVLDLNMQRMNEIYKAIDEWKDSGRSELFGSNEKAMWEAFDEAWEDAVDYAKKLKGYIEDIHDNIGQVMDDMYDAMDRRNDLFDQVDNQYEYLKNMTELVHGEKAYDMLEKVTRKQAQAGEERLKTLEEERKVNHDMLEKLEKGSEEYLQALEKEQELDKDILDVRENIAETYKEAKELANELAVQNWLDNFTGDINGVEVPLEYAADQWERIKENADNYLDDLNRAWELEKLENEYLKLIDDAVDPNIQKQITKQMQEQLGYLREKDKLSEYDVKYANAQLEILQKTIALEDARANKNQMKLRRDSQGNYSYVYAANRNDVRDKENDLLDARMNGYNMSVEASRNATDDYFSQIQNMADKLRNAANDASLSAEQVDAITQDIIDKGYEYLNAKGEQLTTAQRNGIESYIQAAKELSELNAGNVLDISQQLEEGLVDDLGMVTDTFHTAVKDWVDGETGLAYFRDAADQTGRDLVRNVEDFVIAVGEANTNIEEPLSGIETKFVDTNTALTNLMASAQDFYGFLEEKSGIVGQAAEDLANYQTALTEMNSKMNDYYNAWEQRGKELESEKAINSQLRIDMNNLQEEYETKLAEAQRRAGGGSGGSGSGGSTDTSNGSVVGYSGRYYSDSWGNGPSGNWFADQPGAVRISSFSRRSGYGDYNVHLETLNGGHLGWVKESQLFDTGGYTGAWGPGGKAAILHEKELVLNAQDTQNMLAAVSVVRGLVEMLKGSTFNLNNMSQRGFASNGIGNNVEQRVEITAEFPNVRSAADIETALLNLSNNAYQYAYNKNEKFM